ncbi:hypothetical protein GYA19_06165 [Candidatus Beckwithbacteria bacterium]|nr:hypothetical protein [Candidatus Beckwithbacteria bacterium]
MNQFINLKKYIEMGEYEPQVLSQFEEFNKLSPHLQWELVRQAIKNRWVILQLRWADTANQLDYSKKPHLKETQKGIQRQMKQLQLDEERLDLYYSKLV